MFMPGRRLFQNAVFYRASGKAYPELADARDFFCGIHRNPLSPSGCQAVELGKYRGVLFREIHARGFLYRLCAREIYVQRR